MRLKNIPGSRESIAASDRVVHDESAWRGRWHEYFGNDHPLRIEIGCGKGRFINTLAAREAGVNFIGIEKYSSVLLRAIERAEEGACANLAFIRMDAENILDVFAPGEVDRIYLNFSDPWPKDRHAKRRLPGAVFLARFSQILKPGGLIEFKTDNTDLFDFALASLEDSAFELLECTRDLHGDDRMNEGNIMTEYEERFSSQGNPIYKYVIRRKERKLHPAWGLSSALSSSCACS